MRSANAPTEDEIFQKKIEEFSDLHEDFSRVLAGKLHIDEYFSSDVSSKLALLDLLGQNKHLANCISGLNIFDSDSVLAAWITKIRFNDELSHESFARLISRSDNIFQGNFDQLKCKSDDSDNDLLAIMWGIEVLNGEQSFDSGVTRVRLPEHVSLRVLQAMEDNGAKKRESTHATGTKLVDKGLGLDLSNELLRKFSPRGCGALLIHPASRDGSPARIRPEDSGLSTSEQLKNAGCRDFDLVLKREDYGFRDTQLHSRVHAKVGFLNAIDPKNKKQYIIGKKNITKKSKLSKKCIKIYGKGKKVHRKEHLSELKNQAAALVDLLCEGNNQVSPLFPDFCVKWAIRIKFPPFEKKIIATNELRKGLGDFLRELDLRSNVFDDRPEIKSKFETVNALLVQARKSPNAAFERMREGNEVLVDCSAGRLLRSERVANQGLCEPVIRSDPDFKKLFFSHLNDQDISDAVRATFGKNSKSDLYEFFIQFSHADAISPDLSDSFKMHYDDVCCDKNMRRFIGTFDMSMSKDIDRLIDNKILPSNHASREPDAVIHSHVENALGVDNIQVSLSQYYPEINSNKSASSTYERQTPDSTMIAVKHNAHSGEKPHVETKFYAGGGLIDRFAIMRDADLFQRAKEIVDLHTSGLMNNSVLEVREFNKNLPIKLLYFMGMYSQCELNKPFCVVGDESLNNALMNARQSYVDFKTSIKDGTFQLEAMCDKKGQMQI